VPPACAHISPSAHAAAEVLLVWPLSRMHTCPGLQSVNGMPCSFAFGGRGIYFGGKDVLVSELSGAFAITAETDKADRHGVFKSARISVQFGGAHLASAQRYWGEVTPLSVWTAPHNYAWNHLLCRVPVISMHVLHLLGDC